ncbi:Cysteine synthase a [Neofusicoccum parvum]|uniref:Cysteine synthase a n=1 Tax=Neofusicoccum parvum TaxID=310453 RepID=A0ACB5RZY5_9PEZI|nr:Cysteine synthase a [Neofusicoccum parvum]
MGLLKPQYLNKFNRAFGIYKILGRRMAKAIEIDEYFGRKALYSLNDFVTTLENGDRKFWNDITSKKTDDDMKFEKTYDNVKIKAIGVWETVGALGVPQSLISNVFPWINARHQFFNTALSPSRSTFIHVSHKAKK